MKQAAWLLQIILPFIWLGMVLGISFLEAPLKFRAPGISLPLGLGIGRLVFQALNRCELLFCGLMVTAIWSHPNAHNLPTMTSALAVVLALQTFWLLPKMDARALAIIEAQATVPASRLHLVYVVVEILKVILLASIGWRALAPINQP
jgi:hypothetical protein